MRKLDNLDLDAHSSDEELDEEGKMAARRARRRFRTGKANLQRTEHAAAKRLRQQAEKQKADLNAMRTKASMLKKLTKDLRSSDPVAVSEAERQAAEIEATMKSLEKLIKQTQTKATMAAITAIQENDLDVYARSNGFDATDMRKSRGYANNGNAMRTGVAPNGAAVGSNDGATLNDGYRGDGRQIIAGVADGSEYLSGLGGGYDDDSRLGDSGETRHKHESATYGHHKTNRVKARNAMNTETSEAGTYHAPYEEHHEEFHGEEWKYGGQGARWQANPSLVKARADLLYLL
eukprot:gene9776-11583_t